VEQLAQLRRRLGIRTAMMASQAFTEASRWLTGQMPQMRAVMDASRSRAGLGELLEAADLGHVELRSRDLPLVVEPDRDLGVALDPRDGVDRDLLHRWSP